MKTLNDKCASEQKYRNFELKVSWWITPSAEKYRINCMQSVSINKLESYLEAKQLNIFSKPGYQFKHCKTYFFLNKIISLQFMKKNFYIVNYPKWSFTFFLNGKKIQIFLFQKTIEFYTATFWEFKHFTLLLVPLTKFY